MSRHISLAAVDGVQSRTVYSCAHRMRSPLVRAVGLIGRKHIEPETAYLFAHCPAVHTCFMRIPIDVIICDKRIKVLAVETMKPWVTSSPKIKGAHTIIEAAAGSAAAAGIVPGLSLFFIK